MSEAERYLYRDTQLHRWIVPLGQHKARAVLISVGVDPKEGPIADLQWVSRPRLVSRKEQTAIAEILGKEGVKQDDRTWLWTTDDIGKLKQ
jgi:hypothetical protein